MAASQVFPISELSGPGQARRVVAALAESMGFDEAGQGRVSIVVTELTHNLVKHAKGGELVVRPIEWGSSKGVELLSIDRGPGIADWGKAFTDGFSTAGTAGEGLGAVRRLSDECSTFSLSTGQTPGTVIRSVLWADRRKGQTTGLGVVNVPLAGETKCGDTWRVVPRGSELSVLMADGLGHGPNAEAASRAAAETFESFVHLEPVPMVQKIHAALRPTRGAAVAVARIDAGLNTLRFVGVGNVAGTIVMADTEKHLVSHNGTAGAQAPRISEFSYPYPADGRLILHTDGISTHWNLSSYPGLRRADAAVVAAVLYRDHRRARDDATVLVVGGSASEMAV